MAFSRDEQGLVRRTTPRDLGEQLAEICPPAAWRPGRVPPPVEEESVLVDAVAFLRRNWGLLSVVSALGVGIGLVVASSQSPEYRATATIEIQGLNENFLNLKEITPVTPVGDTPAISDLQTQLRILRSNSLLERTLARLPAEKIPPPQGALAVWMRMRGIESKPPTAADVLKRASTNLVLGETREARIVDLTYSSPDADYAAKFVNTLAQQYISQTIESRLEISEGTSAFLKNQMEGLRRKLEQSQARLAEYAERSGLLVSGEDRAPAAEKLRQIQTNLTNTEQDRMTKQARLETIASAPAESIPSNDISPKRDFKAQLAELRRQRADLLAVYQPGFAAVQRVEAQIQTLESELRTESMVLVDNARNEFADAVRREMLLRDSYVEQRQLVSQEAEDTIQYSILKNEVDSNQRVYEMMVQRTAEAKVAAAMRASSARLMDAAKPPALPYRPSRAMNILWGGTAGLLFGLVAANARESLDRRIKKPGDLGLHLNVPELGILPAPQRSLFGPQAWPGKGRNSTGILSAPPPAIAESCRAILTSILFSDEVARVPQIIVITSAASGEGKTTLATHLAASLARMKRRVLLIDGDLRRPQLHTLFGVPNTYGLSDLLALQTDNTDLIGYVAQATSVPGVHLLAAGPTDANALDMLYSSGTLNLLTNARREFDTIIIDTPPMTDLPDARILGRMSDGVVLVVKAGVTTRDVALAAKVRLEEDRTVLLGTVLNH
jgi:capsular exopolysaccharide synthesis family protein